METDHRRSIGRIERSEMTREEHLGAGLTRQGQAIVSHYLIPLTNLIADNLSDRRRSRVRSALIPLTPSGVAFRLLAAGVSLSLSPRYGTDADGNKSYIDQALWIGAHFELLGEVAFRVGVWGLDRLCQLGRFKLVDDRLCLVINDGDIDALLEITIVKAAEHNPLLKPLAYRPTPWTGFRSGGLSKNHWATVQLVRSYYPSTENIFRHALAGNSPLRAVLDGLNYLQATPFTINRPILDLVRRYGKPVPPTDAEIARKVAQKKAQHKKRTKKAIYKEIEQEHLAQVGDWLLDEALAQVTATYPRCFVPLNFDFRGRLNPICGLSVYRSDRVRGLFQFADGEVITPDGVQWLKQFVARLADSNSFSEEPKPSRLDLDGRIAWTNQNLLAICLIGYAVVHGLPLFATLDGIDDRFQFAAACVELYQAIDAGVAGHPFVTRLPIQFDASCSGLQHLCAMARAPEGRYVNLGPAPIDHFGKPDDAADIYTLIARELALRYPPFGDRDEAEQRKICKTPIMTMVYGAGIRRQAKQIEENWHGADAKELAEAVREALTKIAPGAMAVFGWVQGLAELCSEHGAVLRWTTPLGFPVINDYRWPITKQIRRPTANPKFFQKIRFAIGPSDRIKRHKANIAAAANFVHSADACLLQSVALACLTEEIPLISIHDCFMTLANHAARLKEVLAERLDIIHQHDWLAELYSSARAALPKSVEVPPPPLRGTLTLATNFHTFS